MRVSRPSRRSSEAGSAAVEAGVTISALLLLIVGTVEFGQAVWTSNTMLLAVEEAGRYAMVYDQGPLDTCGAQSQAPRCPILSNTPLANCSAARAQRVLSAYKAPNIDVSVRGDSTSSPATITICASYSLDCPVATSSLRGPQPNPSSYCPADLTASQIQCGPEIWHSQDFSVDSDTRCALTKPPKSSA